MKAKEKAESIMKRMLHEVSGVPEPLIFMYHKGDIHVETARACALIAANEAFISVDWASDFNDEKRKFWQSVKQEIEKL